MEKGELGMNLNGWIDTQKIKVIEKRKKDSRLKR